ELPLEGCTLFTSGEPCPMCMGAIIWAGVSRVVFGASIEELSDAGQPQISTSAKAINKTAFTSVELQGGVLAVEALKVVHDWSERWTSPRYPGSSLNLTSRCGW